MERNIIAILRGICPNQACSIAEALIESGITKIEIPLNSLNALRSIEVMVKSFEKEIIFGAGTVLNLNQVKDVHNAGGKIIVSPNCNVNVIKETKKLNMLSFPGVFTPSECFMALNSGADGLKFFPAFLIGPNGFSAIKTVLPKNTLTYAVGGVAPKSFLDWFRVGISGFGVGSALYKNGDTNKQIFSKAKVLIESFDQALEKMVASELME